MAEPNKPMKKLFRPPFDEERKARVWRQVRARTKVGSRPANRRWIFLVAAAIVLVAAGVVAAPWRAWIDPPSAPPAPSAAPPVASSVALVTSAAPPFEPAISQPDAGDPPAIASAISAMPSAVVTVDATDAAVARWRALEAEGSHERAYDALGPGGVEVATRKASLDDLFALADVARLSGHPREAVAPLERVVREFPDDRRSSLAAFTLGRLYLGTIADPLKAAWAFERAIERGVPGGLEEDAYASLVEAKARAGDIDGARAAYAKATQKFPSGRRDAEMKRWIEQK